MVQLHGTAVSWQAGYNDTFDLMELKGERAVIGKGGAVTTAINVKKSEQSIRKDDLLCLTMICMNLCKR